MASYDTQQKLIGKKAQEKGIAPSIISDYFHEKLGQVYAANPHCAESWALGRTEYLVWEHFFSEDPFPGRITTEVCTTSRESSSGGTMDGVSTKVNSPRSPRMHIEPGEVMETDQPGEVLETHEVSNLPPRPLNIQERLIAVASTCGIRASDVQYSFGQQLSYIKDRYPRDSLQWQQWLAGSKVWEANFPQKGSYPFPEPARPYVLLSTNISSSLPRPPTGPRYQTVGTRRDGRSIDEKGTRGPSRRITSRSRSPVRSRKSGNERNSRRHRSRSRERYANKYTNRLDGNKSSRNAVQVSSSNGGGSGVKSDPKMESATGHHPTRPPGYRTNESTMEKKAISLNCRHEFFVCLQKNRDLAKKQHRDCDQNYRGWLADCLTWQTVFKGPFPWLSEEPVVEHSNTCSKSMARASKDSINAARVLPVENKPFVDLPCRLRNQMSSIPSNSPEAIKDNNQTRLISSARSIGTSKSKTTLYHPTIDVNNKEIPCPGKFGLLCDVFSREIRADIFVQMELGCSMYFGAKMETIYLHSIPLEGLSADQSSKENLVLKKADAFLEAWATKCVDGSVGLGDFWREYQAKTSATLGDLDMDVDALLKEEAAKVEGASRKVFDEVSRKVVPLKDYEIMIRTRLLNVAHEATSTPATNVGALKDISNEQVHFGRKG